MKIFRRLKNFLRGRKRIADKEISLEDAIKIIEANSEFIDGKIWMEISKVWKYSPGRNFLGREKREAVTSYIDNYVEVIEHLKERYEDKEEMYQFQLQIFKNGIVEKHYIDINGMKTLVPVGEETAWYEPQDITRIEYTTNKLQN